MEVCSLLVRLFFFACVLFSTFSQSGRPQIFYIISSSPSVRTLTTIDIVSHSFGTHLVGWALYDLAPRNLRFGTIILSGSVLKVGFPWQELIDRYVVARVINDCGLQDSVLVLSQLCVLLTGMAGRLGFQGGLNERFVNRYFRGGHGLYFLPEYLYPRTISWRDRVGAATHR